MKKGHLFLIALAVVLALAAPAVRAGMIIDLEMNEGAGTTTADSSGNGNNGTLTSSQIIYPIPIWKAVGHTGSCLETFTGNYIQVPRSPSLDITGAFHASMWVKPYGMGTFIPIPDGTIETLSGTGGGFSKGQSSDASGYGMYLVSNAATVHGWIGFVKAGGKDFYGPQGVAADRVVAGAWNLIEIDFDGSQTYRLYVNNSVRYTGLLPEPDTVKISARDLYVGHEQIVGTYIDGRVDEFKITTEVPATLGFISGTITLQDFVGDLSLVPVRIEVKQGATVIKSEQKTLDQTGSYVIGPFTAGTYEISFSACKFRKKVVSGVEVHDGGPTVVSGPLLNGDLNGDNSIGTPDFDILSGNFGKLGD
ncbi:MAG: hypothetical protein A2147_04795 [Chloroflexi bacterium RBG_16_57_8]|nr:MAG: hypothetical protein A2147_04795 [Chloroflexi bacterium RBG_16_57_8]